MQSYGPQTVNSDTYVIDGNTPGAATKVAAGTLYSAAAADVDGDGQQDIVTISLETSALILLAGNGNGTFRTARALATLEPVDLYMADVVAEDFTGDGRIDLLLTQEETRRAYLLERQDDGSFVRTQTLFSEDASGAAAGDFDGDGFLDVALSASRNGVAYLHLSRCRDTIPGTARGRRRSVRH